MPSNPTRDRIVETAFRLFLTQGYDRTTTAQLVAATGLSKGAIYHHFQDKEEIRAATIGHFLLRYLTPPAQDADDRDTDGDVGRDDDGADRQGDSTGADRQGDSTGADRQGDSTGDGTGTGVSDHSRPPLGLATVLRHVAEAYARLLETVTEITADPLAYHRFVLAAAPGLQDPLRAASEQLRETLTDAARTSQRAGAVTTAIPARQIAEGAASVVEGAGLLWSLDPQGSASERLRSIVDDHLLLLALPRKS